MLAMSSGDRETNNERVLILALLHVARRFVRKMTSKSTPGQLRSAIMKLSMLTDLESNAATLGKLNVTSSSIQHLEALTRRSAV